MAAVGATTLMKFVSNPVAGVVTTYDARNCSNGGTSIMNGSDVTPSKSVPFEYWATSTGLSASIVAAPSMIRSMNSPRSIEPMATPLSVTVVPSCAARIRNVSPLRRVASGAVTNRRPHAVVGGSCSTMWSQKYTPIGDVRALVPTEHADLLVRRDDGPREVVPHLELEHVAEIEGHIERQRVRAAFGSIGRRDPHVRVVGRGDDARFRPLARAVAEHDVVGAEGADREDRGRHRSCTGSGSGRRR